MLLSPLRLAAIAGLLVVPALADQASSGASVSPAQLRQAVEKAKKDCSGDIKRFCSNVTPGQGRVVDCLSAHSDKLSQSCASSREEMNAIAKQMVDRATLEFRKDCGADVRRFCARVPAGQGRLLDCLSHNEDRLSSSCKDFHSKLQEKVSEYWSSRPSS